MDVDAFIDSLTRSPDYRDQIVHIHESPARKAEFGGLSSPLPEAIEEMLQEEGIKQLYTHQVEAIEHARAGRNVVIATGTASGKSLAYTVPLLEGLLKDSSFRAILLFPTKALCQDQCQRFKETLKRLGRKDILAGVIDGDTPSSLRRKLRDQGSVLFTNPDMLHASILPQHPRWAGFLSDLRLLVLDELHVYTGMFGTNVANLLRRFHRISSHYQEQETETSFQILSSSATIANPKALAEELTGRPFSLVEKDGSPRGRRVVLLWNPPRERKRIWRSRRSANVEAHELMARLIEQNVPTITFSKARVTAEMIHRYVTARLQKTAPHLAGRITPYRGGYRPHERRDIEKKLFSGELMGVSSTRALELGIDVGSLDAAIIVGYPGTLASFFQQAGRAGRQERDALVILIGLDTSINQYVMGHPEYLFERAIEMAVLDSNNPFVITQHLRCATHELPLPSDATATFGPHADLVLRLLEENQKVNCLDKTWYHAANEVPQHEASLRGYSDANVLIQVEKTGEVIGEVDVLDAPPLLHPDAIYMHLGDTYLVKALDLDRRLAYVDPVNVDYYTQALGGTDIHHIDYQLREKPFGAGKACWGEVTAYFGTHAYEKIRFYTLDAFETHKLNLPVTTLDTMAVWLVPPEELMVKVRDAGLDAHAGLRGIGYATRMLLPLFMTCDTLDFSHTVGAVNAPWNAVFIYERYLHGLGFTMKAYDRLHEIMPRVLQVLEDCPCDEGCPCCVGKPLRQYTTWNVERGEASIPSKPGALMILQNMLGDRTRLECPDSTAILAEDRDDRSMDYSAEEELRLEQALRRRLERSRDPDIFHPIRPRVETEYPEIEKRDRLQTPDVETRGQRRASKERDFRKRLAKKLDHDKIPALGGHTHVPGGMKTRRGDLRPDAFHSPVREVTRSSPEPEKETQKKEATEAGPKPSSPVRLGDSLAARARRRKKRKQ